jgi:cob(I)alamin adenosyltransferase
MTFKIYTKTGDDGTTGLVGGPRVKKSNLRLDAYGTVDELNAHIGLILAQTGDAGMETLLHDIQNKLFVIGSKLATDEKGKSVTDNLKIAASDIAVLEKAIDKYDEELVPLQYFILPSGSVLVSQCHIARTVCRRAERRIVELAETTGIEEAIVKYINRLSDFLFTLSRKIAKDQGVKETRWVHD